MTLAHALAQPSQTVTRLAEVKRIFVDSLGDAPGADEMRLKLQNRLSKARNVIVVATPPMQMHEVDPIVWTKIRQSLDGVAG
jgi:hypothetical protein